MRLLILGGTNFVGRHIAEAALAAGHDVTLFNRGTTRPRLFPSATHLVGDRATSDLRSLTAGTWDAVIDVNAYVPRWVREMSAALAGRVGHYTFISTVSVYEHGPSSGPRSVAESGPLKRIDDPATEAVDDATYGPLKVLCEQEVQAAFPRSSTVIRPGIIVGPHDHTDRFTWWVRRIARGGEVLLPDRQDQPMQVVHARDLADFVVLATERGTSGTFNVVGPSAPLTLAGMVQACADAAGAEVEPVWVSPEFVAEHSIPFPLYLPPEERMDDIFEASPAAAEAAGFVNRPISDTVGDTLAWDRERGHLEMGPHTLSADREAELVARWRQQP